MPSGVYVRTEKMKKARYWLGRVKSAEHNRKISETMKKKGLRPPSPKGRKLSDEWKMRMSIKMRGANGSNWQGGKTEKNLLIRNGAEYKIWRKSVFERDDYTCVLCKQRGGRLNADHIKPFSIFIELRFDINNGRTLCVDCHKKTETFAGKARNYNMELEGIKSN